MSLEHLERTPIEECRDAFGLESVRAGPVLREPGPDGDPFVGHDGEELAPVEPMDPHELNALVEDWDNEGGWRWDL